MLMLIAKVYINEKKIDEIWVHNLGTVYDGRHLYSIEKPEGHEDVELWHNRELGYEPLLIKVLHYLKIERSKKENAK